MQCNKTEWEGEASNLLPTPTIDPDYSSPHFLQRLRAAISTETANSKPDPNLQLCNKVNEEKKNTSSASPANLGSTFARPTLTVTDPQYTKKGEEDLRYKSVRRGGGDLLSPENVNVFHHLQLRVKPSPTFKSTCTPLLHSKWSTEAEGSVVWRTSSLEPEVKSSNDFQERGPRSNTQDKTLDPRTNFPANSEGEQRRPKTCKDCCKHRRRLLRACYYSSRDQFLPQIWASPRRTTPLAAKLRWWWGVQQRAGASPERSPAGSQ